MISYIWNKKWFNIENENDEILNMDLYLSVYIDDIKKNIKYE